MEIGRTGWGFRKNFKPHQYLKAPPTIAACCYVGVVAGRPVGHASLSTKSNDGDLESRIARLVVMPGRQGIGLGLRSLDCIARLKWGGKGRIRGRRLTSLVNASHPPPARRALP